MPPKAFQARKRGNPARNDVLFVVHHVSFLFVASSGSDILTDDPLISGLLSVQIGFHPYFQKRFLVDSPELHKIY